VTGAVARNRFFDEQQTLLAGQYTQTTGKKRLVRLG